MEEIVYLSIRFGCTAYLLYKVWKQKERIGKICDLLYTPRNRPQAEKDNGEPGNAQDVMGAPDLSIWTRMPGRPSPLT